MYYKYNIQERCRRILEQNGGFIADKARTILLEDPALKDLRPPLEFISKNWRNPLTPAMMSLSCQAVGGRPEETYDAASAMTLVSLSFYVWDDIVDKAAFKLFKPTLFGKFGEGISLIIGGLAAAKAFSILNQLNTDKAKSQAVTKLCWILLGKMAQAEIATLKLQSRRNFSSKKKFWKIRTEAAYMETCLRIGAILGNGSESEIQHLGSCGLYLGIILELSKDFHVSANLTAGLAERIRSGMLPYSLLWASERSEKLQRKLDLSNKSTITQAYVKEIVEDALKTRMLDHTAKTIRRFTKKTREELIELKESTATRTLQLFIEAQSSLFMGSLSTLQAYES